MGQMDDIVTNVNEGRIRCLACSVFFIFHLQSFGVCDLIGDCDRFKGSDYAYHLLLAVFSRPHHHVPSPY